MAYQWFREGVDVEIASINPCQRGVYFPGKVVAPSFDDSNKFLVEYDTITNEEEGTTRPFSEDVRVGLLRPRPPLEDKLGFKCNDSVDAFFHGGWREGVVAKCLDKSCYLVHLKSMKQSYQFRASELRVHREWIRGAWCPPYEDEIKEEADDDDDVEELPARARQKPRKRALHEFFGKGNLVEVSSDEEGFEGAWYGATIIEKRRKDKFLIEYLSLRADDGEKYLREEVDAIHLRPHPMETLVTDAYNRNSRVDCFYNDGWWEGRVVKVLDESRYRVYFHGTDEEMDFHYLEMRPHQDWVDGKWVKRSRNIHRTI
ncbi:protein AGENET DOMAIN (AGD)-CONTAINING P1-like [Punica granatum]|uniref:Agenet domain-containing protein n=2 Tax=Punica granatum TaxID=22663 RepID=A0A218XWP1_PUNGR|nr:protein AGENET DOMAIN (AGD)-CONTAINING P1-like [Punica granatum]XP_031384800.1 protein AGENET DOMAIN (AGD)-CONTAINING P1-like [Punica granatum]OWM89393.1 hypothetical protein CDL15_Pgr024141 [Punica granatum]PKI40372.1 hypothetical protein CRG98_039218 [Punica granatum]